MTTTLSYAPEVQADASGTWTGNALRFATETEAQQWVRDLERRWFLVTATRVVPSPDPVNYTLVPDADGRFTLTAVVEAP